ncbi:MAG: hypothetical protein Q9171_007069 [Xanthocarpia ochracea]
MSQKRWNEYKELAAYVAAPVNEDTPHIPAEFPELRATVDENITPPPNDPSESMSAKDHDEDRTMQQAGSTTTTAHEFQFAPVDYVTAPDRVEATTTKLPSAGSTAPSYEGSLDTLCAADVLQSMVHDNGPFAIRHTRNSPTGSNPFEHSCNPPTTGIATTGSVFGNGSLANTSFDFDFDFNFDADFDAFIGAPNLASHMSSRHEPLFDGFANSGDDDTNVGMDATMDPAGLDHNDNDNINNNSNIAAFTSFTYTHRQQNNNNENDTTATPSPIDLFLERESPFIFGNTANRFTNFAPRVELPPTSFTVLSPSLKRRRSDSSPFPPTSSPALPNRCPIYRRHLAPTLAPAPSLSLPHSSSSTTTSLALVTLSARLPRFLEATGIRPAALSKVLQDIVLHTLVPLTERRYGGVLGNGRLVVVEGLERNEIRVWVE